MLIYFLVVRFSSSLWYAISSLFSRKIQTSSSWLDLILDAMHHGFNSQIASLWYSSIVDYVAMIWKMRSATIFYNETPNVHVALRFLWTSIKENDFFCVGNMYNSFDDL